MALLLALIRSRGHPAVLLDTARSLSTILSDHQLIQRALQSPLCSCSSAAGVPWSAAAAAQQQQTPTSNAPKSAQHSSRRTFFSHFTKPDSKVYKERRLIGYSPEQLYEVVSGVQHYHQFVPWCVGSHVLKRNPDGSYLEAELQIGFQMISERYTSRVKLQAPHSVSSTVADSALFHHLESTWQLKPGPNPNSTWLSFSVDFAFLNPLYANIAHLFFSEVVTRMMGAFEGRCKQLYGPPSFSPAGQRHIAQQQHHQRQQHVLKARHHQQQHHRVQPAGGQAALLQHEAAAAAATTPEGSGTVAAVQQHPGSHQRQQQQPQHKNEQQ